MRSLCYPVCGVWDVCSVSLRCLRSLFCVFDMFKKLGQCLWDVWKNVLYFWDVFLRCLREAEIGVQNQSLQKLERQKTLANENTGNAEFDAYPVWSSAARAQTIVWQTTWQRQREQSQEPLNTTWPQKPEASYWNITTLWANRKARTKAGKTDPQNVSANSNKWQRWIWRIIKSGWSTHSANQSKSMKDNMARKREQSQDEPAWKPLQQNDDHEAWSVISNRHDGVGLKKRDDKGGMDSVKWQYTQNLSRDLALHGWQVQRCKDQVTGAETRNLTIIPLHCVGRRCTHQHCKN